VVFNLPTFNQPSNIPTLQKKLWKRMKIKQCDFN
jgi:hypothetical protein